MSKHKNLKGFTLLEVLVATGILVMVGVAAIGIEKQFMGSASTNKHKLQATALAQEGISVAKVRFNIHIIYPNDSENPDLTAGDYIINNENLVSGTSQIITQNGVTFTRTITIIAQ